MAIDPDQVRLIQGNTSNIQAEVFCGVQQDNFEMPPEACLEGPFSSRGKTLTAKYPLAPIQIPGVGSHWRIVIPEPSVWTPRMPAYYELRGVPGVRKRIGLRELFTRGDSFYREGQRWVARAAFTTLNQVLREIDPWYETGMVPILSPEFIAFRDYAVEYGLPLILDHSQWPASMMHEEFLRCIPYASVAMVLLPPNEDLFAFFGFPFPEWNSLLRGVKLTEPVAIPKHAHFVAVSEELLRDGWKPDRRLPVVATRKFDLENHSPAELRAMCDQFQTDLDHGADYAGLWLLPKASS